MKYIAIDFDGTIVKHKFPEIGELVPNVQRVIKQFKTMGFGIILLTMRSDGERKLLTEAVDFCKQNGIEFDYINENPNQDEWTSSRKVYASHYIDDNNIGCPLLLESNEKPYVNWNEVELLFLEKIFNE